jgi:hypothetical protein
MKKNDFFFPISLFIVDVNDFLFRFFFSLLQYHTFDAYYFLLLLGGMSVCTGLAWGTAEEAVLVLCARVLRDLGVGRFSSLDRD